MYRYLLALLSLLLALPCAAQNIVKVGTGYVLPPYVIPETQSGYELDIVRAAFTASGLTVQFVFYPPARALYSVRTKAIDAVTTINENSGLDGFWSDSHISYQNYAITLQSSGLKLNQIADLAGHTVSAFQNARLSLGPDYAKAVARANYQEYPDQLTQNKLLYSHRTEIVVADKLIFNYLIPQLGNKFKTQEPLQFHPIFPPTPYQLLFNDAQLRDQFNRGLAIIRANGQYQRIQNHYLPSKTGKELKPLAD
jgi:polar amino acid transport system substrate-binding protein